MMRLHRHKLERMSRIGILLVRYIIAALVIVNLGLVFWVLNVQLGVLLTACGALLMPFVIWYDVTAR